MKILHLAVTLQPVGGTEIYLASLMAPLARRGHENLVVCTRRGPESAADPHIQWIQEGVGTQTALTGAVRNLRPDVVLINGAVPPELVREAARLAPTAAYIHDFHPLCPGLAKLFRKSGRICDRPVGLGCIPNIYLQHCASARRPGSVLKILERAQAYLRVYRELPSLLVASVYMRALLVQNGAASAQVSVLPQFTTVSGPDPWPADGLPPLILFAGRLELEKGFHQLLDALALLRSDWRLAVAGDGTQRAAGEARVAQFGWSNRVTFHGWLSEIDLARLYARSSVVVLPSIWPEPFGRAGLDALARGRPVVAFDVGGVSEWLTGGRNGWLVPLHDVGSFAGRLGELVADPERAAQLGRNGAEDAAARFGPDAHIDRLLDALETVAAEPR